MPNQPVKVLYIAGAPRSETTILGNVLGQLPTCADAGELRLLWKHGLEQNRACGCGEAFLDCPFWAAVGSRAFGGFRGLDVTPILSANDQLHRFRRYPAMLFAPTRRRILARQRDYFLTLRGCTEQS